MSQVMCQVPMMRQNPATLPNTAVVILSTDAFEDQFWLQTAPLRAKGITAYRLSQVPAA